MKKSLMYMGFVLLIVVLGGCGGQKETDYEYGDVQNSYIMVSGTIYVHDGEGRVDTLPEGSEYVGEVLDKELSELPENDLEACRIEAGSKVYFCSDEDSVYVSFGDSYRRYIVDTEHQKNISDENMTA